MILLLVIVAPMTIASRGLKSAFFANDQITAVFLAQEASESLEKLRNNNALEVMNGSGDPTWDWFANINTSCKNSDGCDIDVSDGSYHSCAILGNCKLKFNTDESPNPGDIEYGYDAGWSDSPFTRVIKLDDSIDDGVKVTITVFRYSIFN